jgi:hypothetical protein
MKKFSLLTLLLLFSAFICLGAGTALGASNGNINSASVQVNLTNQNPDSARPGETVELTFSVQNVGKNDLKDITVTVEPEYPFSKLSEESLVKSISYLNARQDDDDAGVLKFKLLTDSNASEGTYKIKVTTTSKSGSGSSSSTMTTTNTIYLEVRGKEYAQIVTIDKSNIDLAKEEPLEFIITNTGNSPLKNMVISWEEPEGVILPVYSDNTKYIKYLAAGESINVVYSVMADVNAEPGLYTLNLNLSYEDYESNEKTIKTTAGLFVGGETDFDVSFSESDAGEISLSVANVGNNMAYSVKVSVPEQDGFKVTGSSSTIVGNLEKGDYTIASFNVMGAQAAGESGGAGPGTAKASAEDNVTSAPGATPPLEVQIEYTDAKGERITVDKDVEIEMTSSSAATAGGRPGTNTSSSMSSYLPYLVIVIVAGAGVFMYRRKKQAGIGKRSGDKKPEEQKYSLKTPRD